MKIISGHLLTLSVIMCFIVSSCNSHYSGGIEKVYADTTIYRTDTTYNNVVIGEKQYTIRILRDKLNNHLEEFNTDKKGEYVDPPLTIVVSNSDSNKIVFAKKFQYDIDGYPDLHYSIYKGQGQALNNPGKLYFMINQSYGGSGSGSVRYLITSRKGKIDFEKLFDSSGELDQIAYNKNDNEILLLKGIWSEGESHFANHRYEIINYIYNGEYFSTQTIGKTFLRYSSLDEGKPIDEILIDMKTNEPILMSSIKVSNYKF